jgi:WD40 repeat protein
MKHVLSVTYSPDGLHILSASADSDIRMWDAKTGAAVGTLEGHTELVFCAAYSSSGSYIVSGSDDRTIRVWDAKTRLALGTLKGHTAGVLSAVYSPDEQHIISASSDRTIRIWDARTGAVVGKPLTGHSSHIWSLVYSPSKPRIASGSEDGTIRVWDPFSHRSPHLCSTCNPIHAQFCTPPDSDGWVKDSDGNLLYWVPPDCRAGLHSPALLRISMTSHSPSVSLHFDDFAFGTSWASEFGFNFVSMPACRFAIPVPCGRELTEGGEMTKPPDPVFHY